MARDVQSWAASIIAVCAWLAQFSTILGNLECEELTPNVCAFAVASSGARCVLEKSILQSSEAFPECQTSTIIAGRPAAWIESRECIKACGLTRETYGLSTDALAESGFADKVCSADCQNNCPNVVDLYLKLAAGQGVYLPRLCMESRSRAQRLISEKILNLNPKTQKGKIKGSKYHNHHQKETGQNKDSQRSLSNVYLGDNILGPMPGPWLAKPAFQSGDGGLFPYTGTESDHKKEAGIRTHSESTSVHKFNLAKVEASNMHSASLSEAVSPEPSYKNSHVKDTPDDSKEEDIYKEIAL